MSPANWDIHTDDPTGFQLILVASASASIIRTMFVPIAFPARTLQFVLGQALSCWLAS